MLGVVIVTEASLSFWDRGASPQTGVVNLSAPADGKKGLMAGYWW